MTVPSPSKGKLRPLLRLEARSLMRHRGRSILIAALVAIPVAAMVGCGTLFRLSQIAQPPAGQAGQGGDDPFVTFMVFVLGGLAFIEAALVIAAAFAVGMRRRQREIGLVGATGAPPKLIWRALLGSAALLAGVGVAGGMAVGMTLTVVLYPHLEGWAGRESLPLTFLPLDLVGAALFGLVTATVAAARPAYTAAKLPVTVALSGRRPAATPASVSGRWGMALVICGAVLMTMGASLHHRSRGLVLITGSALSLIGLCCLSGWLLDRGARRAGPLPLGWRLAIRDAGRFRSRNAPVIAAITAAMSMSVMLLGILASVEAHLAASNPGADLSDADGGSLFYVAVAISSGTSLVVVLVVTALSLVESAADARALQSVGARPGLVRRLAAARACYLAVLGSALAVPGGLLPVMALVHGENSPLAFEVPWLRLVAVLSVLPVAAYAAMWLLSRSPWRTGSLRSLVT